MTGTQLETVLHGVGGARGRGPPEQRAPGFLNPQALEVRGGDDGL